MGVSRRLGGRRCTAVALAVVLLGSGRVRHRSQEASRNCFAVGSSRCARLSVAARHREERRLLASFAQRQQRREAFCGAGQERAAAPQFRLKGWVAAVPAVALLASEERGQGTTRPLLVASVTGLLTGASVVLLNVFVHWGREALASLPGDLLPLLGPALAGSVVSLLLLLRGSQGLVGGTDLPALKAAGGRPPQDAAVAPLRAFAAGVTLAGGNSLGPEGPSVEIGANIAATLGQAGLAQSDENRLGSENRDKEEADALRMNLLAAGCASGIAAGFNAPVAGLFFALESVRSGSSSSETARASGPAMQLLAAVLAATVSQLGLGSSPAVDLDVLDWAPAKSLWELPLFLLLGALCGITAAALRLLGQLAARFFGRLEEEGLPRFSFPILAGLAVVAVPLAFDAQEVLYRGFDNVNLVLQEVDGAKAINLAHLCVLLVVKVLLTAVCQTSGQVGGLFAPALFMGATLGGLLGRGLRDYFWPWAIFAGDWLGEEVSAFSVPTTYSIVGMAACLGSICGVPLTAVVLLLELGGGKDYGVVLPTVAAVGVAVYVEDLLTTGWKRLSSAQARVSNPGESSPLSGARAAAAVRPLRDSDNAAEVNGNIDKEISELDRRKSELRSQLDEVSRQLDEARDRQLQKS